MAEVGKPGRAGLRKARFFLKLLQATEQRDPLDREASEAYLKAAIIYGKTAKDMVEKEVKRQFGDRWRDSSPLWSDPICKFVSDIRNIIVHEDGAVDVISRTSITVHASVGIAVASGGVAIASVTPSNPTPWQRVQIRRQAQLDKKHAARIQKREQERTRRLLRKLQAEAQERDRFTPSATRTTRLHFLNSNPQIADQPAANVVSNYLDRIEQALTQQ